MILIQTLLSSCIWNSERQWSKKLTVKKNVTLNSVALRNAQKFLYLFCFGVLGGVWQVKCDLILKPTDFQWQC